MILALILFIALLLIISILILFLSYILLPSTSTESTVTEDVLVSDKERLYVKTEGLCNTQKEAFKKLQAVMENKFKSLFKKTLK